jgi:hypothetical protein
MTAIGFVIGLVIFLGVGWLFLAALLLPFLWFKAYLELEEIESSRLRDDYRKRIQSVLTDKDDTIASPETYKKIERKGLKRFTENEILVELIEWLFSWGFFLLLQGFWTYSLYRWFSSFMEVVGEFLDKNFFLG